MGTFGLALLLTTLLNCLNGGEPNFIQIQFCANFGKDFVKMEKIYAASLSIFGAVF